MRRYSAIVAFLCVSGTATAEPISDLKAFHAAWRVAQLGQELGDAAMIVGGLDVFSRIAPSASDGGSGDTVVATAWDQQIASLAAEAVFLSRDAPLTLPDGRPDRFLPAVIHTVPPGAEVRLNAPGEGNRAVLVLSGAEVQTTLTDGGGKDICATMGPALFCVVPHVGSVTATLFNRGDAGAQVLLMGEMN